MIEFMFALAIGMLFGIGVFQLLRRDLIKAAIGFAILFSAINLFFVSVGSIRGRIRSLRQQCRSRTYHQRPADPGADIDGNRGQLWQFFAGLGFCQYHLAAI